MALFCFNLLHIYYFIYSFKKLSCKDHPIMAFNGISFVAAEKICFTEVQHPVQATSPEHGK